MDTHLFVHWLCNLLLRKMGDLIFMPLASVLVAVMNYLYSPYSRRFLFYRSYAGGSMSWIAWSFSMSRPIIFFAQSRQ